MFSQTPLWLILVAFICAIGPLVFFHELGHYLVARAFRIPAETFSIGFGREVVGWTDSRGTRWKVGWLPLGGYVKFVGDMSPASNPADPASIPPEMRDRAFQLRPVWQRFLVVLAGPAANFLLAIIIFAAFFAFIGAPTSNVVGGVAPDTPAARAGIQQGDRIVSVAGRPTPTFADLYNATAVRPGETIIVEVERGGALREVRVTLGSEPTQDTYGRTFQRGMFGVHASSRVLEPMPPATAVVEGVNQTFRLIGAIADGLVQMIRGYVSPKQLGGPITIAKVAGDFASLGPLQFAQLLAFLSINLGFINLLPVPMLDGGHLAFYAVEAVRRRPLSARALDLAFRGGLAIILALVVFTTVNDLASIGLWDRLQRLIG
ncbi:MAG TPA: M50 family metallopeptidase [Sphingomicrobium sp.]|nr:M50 family metallopeptidase [Sphingomicrobium sp.]